MEPQTGENKMSVRYKERIIGCAILLLLLVAAAVTGYKSDGIAEQARKEREWKEAYAAYIQRGNDAWSGHDSYSLIYVDDDEIPELYIDTRVMATGEFVASFYDGNIGVMNRDRVGLRYMEYGGLLYSQSGNMGFYPCNIYRLEKGTFSEIGTGWCSESFDGENMDMSYFWEGNPVTEKEYEAHIGELIDTSACVEPSELYTKEEILEILEEGEVRNNLR